MRISRELEIAGVPALQLRHFFKRMGGSPWNHEDIQTTLRLDEPNAKALVAALVAEGYAETSPILADHGYYEGTIKAGALACAKAGRPIKRATADRLIEGAIQRATAINGDPAFLHWVTKISAFGSYLTDASTLGDVDLVVELTPRISDQAQHLEATRRYSDEAVRKGRRFGTFVEKLYWPEQEIFLLIKNRSSYLSLHSRHDDVLQMVETRALYEYDPVHPHGG